MAILKNEPVYNFKDGDYCKPHHIIVKGSWKEIGFDLATIGKNEYGVKLLPYYSPRLWQSAPGILGPELAARGRIAKGSLKGLWPPGRLHRV